MMSLFSSVRRWASRYKLRSVIPVTLDDSGEPVHPITTVTGSHQSAVLAPDNADAAADNKERYDSATGCLGFQISLLGIPTALVTHVVYGWSTTAGDLANINSDMAEVVADMADPTTAVNGFKGNVGVIRLIRVNGATSGDAMADGDIEPVLWDGTDTIKTIAVRSVGADLDTGVRLKMEIPA